MAKIKTRFDNFFISLRVGWFLAIRQVKRSSIATTGLIIFVMMLTFLNLVVVRGVLVGLIQGSTDVFKSAYAGDILISTLPKKDFIENSPSVIQTIEDLPWTESVSARILDAGTLEADYKTRLRLTDDPNSASGQVAGVDPLKEEVVTKLSTKIVEGNYLTPFDTDSVLIGSNLLKKYVTAEAPGLTLLTNVNVGTKLRLTIGNVQKEVTVKGVISSRSGILDQRIVMLDSTLRSLTGKADFNVGEVAVKLKPGVDPTFVKNVILATSVKNVATVQTADEAIPSFLVDIKNTFGILGNVVGSIGLVVASITIFIVIFVNAITRRKYIGILKGIGIHATAIEFAYVLQSIFYAGVGIALGLLVLYGFLVPYIEVHPVKFPFSDGILVAELSNTMIRAGLLMIATLIAGYIPARIVVKQNTLDAILGRK
jgi:putative ABC transport system permease protein